MLCCVGMIFWKVEVAKTASPAAVSESEDIL